MYSKRPSSRANRRLQHAIIKPVCISTLRLGLFRAETRDNALQGSEVVPGHHVNLNLPRERLRGPGPSDI